MWAQHIMLNYDYLLCIIKINNNKEYYQAKFNGELNLSQPFYLQIWGEKNLVRDAKDYVVHQWIDF